jgi:hypothetical protein
MAELDVDDADEITGLLADVGLGDVHHFERRRKRGVLAPHWYALFRRV